jgi:hypothetical protein
LAPSGCGLFRLGTGREDESLRARQRHAVRIERMSLDLLGELASVFGASLESAVAMK